MPSGPSNSYFFSTASHGIRRRKAASASRARVNSFSLTSSCWRAASHTCGDTIGGVFMAISAFRFCIGHSGLFEPGLEVGELDRPAFGHQPQHRAVGFKVVVDDRELDLVTVRFDVERHL